MDAAKLPKKAELIEQYTNTFGIEVEFCSIIKDKQKNDSIKRLADCLSYSHIEVCTIKHGDYKWIIETDSDYTLELVSPILVFGNHQKANEFKMEIIKGLAQIVLKPIALQNCIEKIKELIKKLQGDYKFSYHNLKTQQDEYLATSTQFTIEYITQEKLVNELNYHNWDDTTELKDLEETKGEIIEIKENFQTCLGSVQVKTSEKHEGIPSSQLNLPMSLKAYVWYSAYVKEPTAWRRFLLLSDESFQKEWRNKTLKKINEINKISGLNSKLVVEFEHSFEYKKDYWYKYWFWLVSIREMTEKALKQISSYTENLHPWRTQLNNAKNAYVSKGEYPGDFLNLDYKDFQSITKINNSEPYKGLPVEISKKLPTNNVLPVEHFWTGGDKQDEIVSSLIYLTVQKLITGALGVLSESVQLQFQDLIVNSNKTKKEALEELKSINSNIAFMDYHSFLKDLTPLWFKGTLGDVLATVNQYYYPEIKEPKEVFQKLIEGINSLDRDAVKTILDHNLKFGQFKKHGFEKKDEDDFKKELFFENMDDFIEQYEKGRKSLIETLKPLTQNLSENMLADISYKDNQANNNKFLDRENVPLWEGRWDTLKPPIISKDKQVVEFLVEHRNH